MSLSQAIAEAPSQIRRKRLPRRPKQLTFDDRPVPVERARQLFNQIRKSLQ